MTNGHHHPNANKTRLKGDLKRLLRFGRRRTLGRSTTYGLGTVHT